MPSSLSLSSFRSSPYPPDLESTSTPTPTKRDHSRRKSVLGLPLSQKPPSPPIAPPRQSRNGELVPPRPLEKTKSWSNRLSSFLPSLITTEADSINRKPVSSMMPPPNTAPPPYKLHEPTNLAANGLENIPPLPPRQGHLPVSASMPVLQTNLPSHSVSSFGNPQIMAPIPPSPESKRATLTKPLPPLRGGPQSQPQQPIPGAQLREAPKANKLQKEDIESRPRHNSLQQPQASPGFPSLHPLSGMNNEPRGRRSVSAQHPTAATQNGPVGGSTRVSTFPLIKPSSPNEGRSGGSQSPSRRIRRSWMPGGRSRSNSTDLSQQGGPKSHAWVISDGTTAEYNPSLLRNAEKVSQNTSTLISEHFANTL